MRVDGRPTELGSTRPRLPLEDGVVLYDLVSWPYMLTQLLP